MIAATLKTITPEHIREVVTRETWQKGVNYFQHDAVLSLHCDGHTLSASVQGGTNQPYEIRIVEKNGVLSRMACTCPYSSRWGWVCKHIVAVMLVWIQQRDQSAAGRPVTPAIRYPETIISSSNPFYSIFTSWFSSFDRLGMHVDLVDGGPGLAITFTSVSSGRQARFIVPVRESPELFQKLSSLPGVDWSEEASRVRIGKSKMACELIADYDGQGRLVLTPGYSLKKPGNGTGFISTTQADPFIIDRRWFWDNGVYFPIDEMPDAFSAYFEGSKPLLYTGVDIIHFFRYSMPAIENEKRFRPSESVKNTHIFSDPALKHLSIEEGNGWLYLAPYYEAAGIRLSLDDIVQLKDKNGFVRQGNNWIFIHDDTVNKWKEKGELTDDNRIRISRLAYARLKSETDRTVSVEEPESLRNLYAILNHNADPAEAPQPLRMKGTLRDYQKTGYNWLWTLRTNGLNGVLADEMGLGKTHQAMALLGAVYSGEHPSWDAGNREEGTVADLPPERTVGEGCKDPAGGPADFVPSIIVTPTTVLDHWEYKLHEFLPWLIVNKYHDKDRSLQGSGPYHVLLTTYSVLSLDIGKLSGQTWEYAILDEAQKIKNYKTKSYRAARSLVSRHRLALTGTPIENQLTELWSIFDFLLPGYLGSLDRFVKEYATPIAKYHDDHKKDLLKKIINPFKLRRLKADVLKELPQKLEDVRYCSLTPHQVSLYRGLISGRGSELLRKLGDTTAPVEYMHIFAFITKLKMLCDHPDLITGSHDRSFNSGKFELFKELVEEAMDSGEKVVVFSQYLKMLDLIEQWLSSKKIRYSSLRGSTRNRAEVIKKFQSNRGNRVFVGSLLAGGLGIDLTSASVVIHYDRWWNAAREEQATDRVHRIGQRKGVQVFKLITRGTLEEKIDNLIMQKAALMNSVVENDDALIKGLSREELMELFRAPE